MADSIVSFRAGYEATNGRSRNNEKVNADVIRPTCGCMEKSVSTMDGGISTLPVDARA